MIFRQIKSMGCRILCEADYLKTGLIGKITRFPGNAFLFHEKQQQKQQHGAKPPIVCTHHSKANPQPDFKE